MSQIENIHATCVSYKQKGILIIGASGTGKSDLALRLIMDKNARLVADDRTNLEMTKERIIASAPQNISGLLEVRGLGICNFKPLKKAEIFLVIELVDDIHKLERMPLPQTYELFGKKLPKLKLYPFESSSIHKVILALK